MKCRTITIARLDALPGHALELNEAPGAPQSEQLELFHLLAAC